RRASPAPRGRRRATGRSVELVTTPDTPLVTRLRAQLGGPRDGALLRYSLGNALLAQGDAAGAVRELRAALDFDATYSAAWKSLGHALVAAGDTAAAADAWQRGSEVADAHGDVQAGKEMAVFLKRVKKPRN